MKCVGGPLDGRDIWSSASVVVFQDEDDWSYHKTLPTDTDWRDTYDHDWFMHGRPQPPPVPEKVYEWHERDWMSPEVRLIREAVAITGERYR